MSYDPTQIEAMVRQVVQRTLGQMRSSSSATMTNRRQIVDAADVQMMPSHSIQSFSEGTIITPLARQAALERHITLEIGSIAPLQTGVTANLAIALGADHGGYELKEQLKTMLTAVDERHTIVDCGTHSRESVDYPDYAYAVARLVADGRVWRGIIIDGAGIGSCMAANKVPGVRAAMCYDQATAVNSREHNNANVLTLGAGLIGVNLAKQIVNTWLATDFGGGRHRTLGRREELPTTSRSSSPGIKSKG